MKKTLILIIIGIILITMTGCNQKKEDEHLNKEDINIVDTDSKSLVLYFSATNNTESVAKKISETIQSDIIEIIPKEEYTSADLNYNNDDCRANVEQNDNRARPEIMNDLELDNYNIIYLGYPIWWGKEPKIILTLLDNYDFEGKTIIPFCTSGGSEIEASISDLKNYNSKLNIKDGRRFNSSVSGADIKSWIESIN